MKVNYATLLQKANKAKNKEQYKQDLYQDFFVLSSAAKQSAIEIIDDLYGWYGNTQEITDNFKLFANFFKDKFLSESEVLKYNSETNIIKQDCVREINYLLKNNTKANIANISKIFLMKEVQEYLINYSNNLFGVQLNTYYVG